MARKTNPNSLKNLKLFEKGNPGSTGRPKGSTGLVPILRRLLVQKINFPDPITGEECNKTIEEMITLTLMAKALKGDIRAIKEVVERMDGKTVQKTELTGIDGKPLAIESITRITADAIDDRIAQLLKPIVKTKEEDKDVDNSRG